MSQANVDLVLKVQPDPDVDVAQAFRDDETWAAWVETMPRSCTRTVSLPFQACSVAERPTRVLRA